MHKSEGGAARASCSGSNGDDLTDIQIATIARRVRSLGERSHESRGGKKCFFDLQSSVDSSSDASSCKPVAACAGWTSCPSEQFGIDVWTNILGACDSVNDILSVGATCTYLRPIALDVLKLHRGSTLKLVIWTQRPESTYDGAEALEVCVCVKERKSRALMVCGFQQH